MLASLFTELAHDLFRLSLSGLICWGFGWMCYCCCQSPPKPQSYRKRRQR